MGSPRVYVARQVVQGVRAKEINKSSLVFFFWEAARNRPTMKIEDLPIEPDLNHVPQFNVNLLEQLIRCQVRAGR